jgi:hypothetical protein
MMKCCTRIKLRDYRLWRQFTLSFFIRFFLICTIPIGMSSGINIRNLSFHSNFLGESLSSFLTVLLVPFLLLLTLTFGLLLWRFQVHSTYFQTLLTNPTAYPTHLLILSILLILLTMPSHPGL